MFVVLRVEHLFFESIMFNIRVFPLSFTFHSQLTALNENDETREPTSDQGQN